MLIVEIKKRGKKKKEEERNKEKEFIGHNKERWRSSTIYQFAERWSTAQHPVEYRRCVGCRSLAAARRASWAVSRL
jgi:hypothetical protein